MEVRLAATTPTAALVRTEWHPAGRRPQGARLRSSLLGRPLWSLLCPELQGGLTFRASVPE